MIRRISHFANYSLNGLVTSVIPIILLSLCLQNCTAPTEKTSEINYSAMADTLEISLFNEMIDVWYPMVIDSADGGYFSNYSYDWKRLPDQSKSAVYTGRHVWTTANIAENYPDKPQFRDYSLHGLPFLKDHMWDQEMGGYYTTVARNGDPIEGIMDEKRIYSQAFAIYGLAELYQVTGDEDALDQAKKSFHWIEDHAHDKQYGGYFEFLKRNGDPMPELESGVNARGERSVQGYKDYNSSIHVLEALTTLYKAWPDDLVRQRLNEMFHVVRDTMVTDPGFLKLYFHADWRPVSEENLNKNQSNDTWYMDHVTFGHDIETAFLIMEASEALGAEHETTLEIAKELVDHTLKRGWDTENGGIFDAGKYITPDSMVIINNHKAWWSEIEALNSLLMMHDYFPDDPHNYYVYFMKQWHYIDTYLIDHEHGGWYSDGLDTDPDNKDGRKAHNWKACYHNSRGMVNCINRLRKLASNESDMMK